MKSTHTISATASFSVSWSTDMLFIRCFRNLFNGGNIQYSHVGFKILTELSVESYDDKCRDICADFVVDSNVYF